MHNEQIPNYTKRAELLEEDQEARFQAFAQARAETRVETEVMTARDRVFLAILDHWRAYAVPPVIRDVCKAAGVSSTSDVSKHYRKLEKAGKIVIVQRHPVPVEILRLIKGVCHERKCKN